MKNCLQNHDFFKKTQFSSNFCHFRLVLSQKNSKIKVFSLEKQAKKLKKNSKNENSKSILRQKTEKNLILTKNQLFSQFFAILASKTLKIKIFWLFQAKKKPKIPKFCNFWQFPATTTLKIAKKLKKSKKTEKNSIFTTFLREKKSQKQHFAAEQKKQPKTAKKSKKFEKIPKNHRRNRIKVVQLLLPSQNWTKRDKKKLKKKRKENLQFRRYRSFDKIAYFLSNLGNCRWK